MPGGVEGVGVGGVSDMGSEGGDGGFVVQRYRRFLACCAS